MAVEWAEWAARNAGDAVRDTLEQRAVELLTETQRDAALGGGQ